jgi:hypothetical protein
MSDVLRLNGCIRVAFAAQHSDAGRSPLPSSETVAIPGNRDVRRVMSKVRRASTEHSQDDLYPRSIVGRMDLQQMRLQGRQVRSGERLVIEPRCSLSPPGARNRDCYR